MITICGSLKQSKDLLLLKEFYNKFVLPDSDSIICPVEQQNGELINIMSDYIDYIMKSDIIVILQKDDGTLGESTTYEYALALYFDKQIMTITPKDIKQIRRVMQPSEHYKPTDTNVPCIKWVDPNI